MLIALISMKTPNHCGQHHSLRMTCRLYQNGENGEWNASSHGLIHCSLLTVGMMSPGVSNSYPLGFSLMTGIVGQINLSLLSCFCCSRWERELGQWSWCGEYVPVIPAWLKKITSLTRSGWSTHESPISSNRTKQITYAHKKTNLSNTWSLCWWYIYNAKTKLLANTKKGWGLHPHPTYTQERAYKWTALMVFIELKIKHILSI